MACPRPTPTALRLLKGDTSKGKDPIPKDDPSLRMKAEVPPMPQNLLRDRVARDEWKRITKLLKGCGILTRVDVRILQLYCDTFSIYREAIKDYSKNGPTIYTSYGNPIQNPAAGVMHKARADMLKYLQELGMTPSARTRVHALPEDQDELSLFCDGGSA